MASRSTVETCLVWSGREDLNLRPLRPERSALPGCATPRLGRARMQKMIVLQQRGKRQPVCFRYSSTRHVSIFQIDPFR